MLDVLGAECAGAVSVLAPGRSPRRPGEDAVHPLGERELGELIEALPRNPLGINAAGGRVRLSLGGVQGKLVLARTPAGEMGLPLEGTPSTEILKPDMGQYEDLVANELFCMRTASGAGLEVADATKVEVGKISCLLVTRFDRELDGEGRVRRLHQEDMCQALGILPNAKYEEGGGPSVRTIVELLRRLDNPRSAMHVRDFLRALVTNFILGNSDAHGKNFALLHDPVQGIRLALLYDLVSTAVYPELTTQMAMRIGGVDDPDTVDIGSWTRLAEEAGLGSVIGGIVQRQAGVVLRSAQKVAKTASAEGWHRPVVDAIVDVCRQRAGRLIDG